MVPGNRVAAEFTTRPGSQLPFARLELEHSRAALITEPLPAAAMQWACGLTATALTDYAGIVGHLLAKGHARTSGASMIAGYLGRGEKAAKAFSRFARLYADQTEADHAALVTAARNGRVPIADGALAAMGSAFRPGG